MTLIQIEEPETKEVNAEIPEMSPPVVQFTSGRAIQHFRDDSRFMKRR
jgi:hypothetical protein